MITIRIVLLLFCCSAPLWVAKIEAIEQITVDHVSPKVNLFLSGFQKAGSTMAFRHFIYSDHRFRIGNSFEGERDYMHKEPHFFDVVEEYQQGVEHYNSRFPDDAFATYYVDATPNYIYNSQNALSRMRNTYGVEKLANLKFIVTLRDPVSRIVSWWNHFVKTPQNLEYTVVSKYESLDVYLKDMLNDRPMDLYDDDAVNTQESAMFRNALVLGMYGKWLEMLLDMGVSAENVHVVIVESIEDDDVNKEFYDFLGMSSPDESTLSSVKNWKNSKKHSEDISHCLRNEVRRWYMPANCKLISLLISRGITSVSWEKLSSRSGGWLPTQDMCDKGDHRSPLSTPILRQTKPNPSKNVNGHCLDTAFGRIDAQNNGCEWYETRRQECGKHDIKLGYSNFLAGHDCCSCGGGTAHEFDTKTMTRLLELVPCVTVVSVDDADSPDMINFFSRAQTVGLECSKIRFQQEVRDPEHSSRGVWNAHKHAWEWGSEHNCDAMMIFEDDAFFSPDEKTERSLANTAQYLNSGVPYDFLLLGYVTPKDHFERYSYPWDMIKPRGHCVYEMPVFDSLHAYIISNDAMNRNRHRTWYLPEGETVWNMDREISKESILGHVNVVAVYPSVSFQSFHTIKNGWAIDAEIQERINRRKANPDSCREYNSKSIRHAPGSDICMHPKKTPAASVFILGVQKCGTSSLHNWIVGHEDIVMAESLEGEPDHFGKELHFFDSKKRLGKGVEYYNAHFQSPLTSSTARYIDATPNYFYNLQGAISNMARTYGRKDYRELKFLVIVKDPTDRLVSWWNHFSKVDVHKKSIMYNVFSRYHSLNEYVKYASDFAVDHKGFQATSCTQQNTCENILSLGVYSKWLRMWLDSGARANQFEIIFLNEFQNNHEVVSERVQSFLGIRPDAWKFKVDITDKSNHRHHHQTLTPHTRSVLERFYFQYNCDFAKVVSGFHIREWADMQAASSGWIPSREACYRNELPPLVPETSVVAGGLRQQVPLIGDAFESSSVTTTQLIYLFCIVIAAYVARQICLRLGPISTLWKKNFLVAYAHKRFFKGRTNAICPEYRGE